MADPRDADAEFSPSSWLVGALVGVLAVVIAVVRTFLLDGNPFVLAVLLLLAGAVALGGVLLLARRER
ncbi:hypothetical protein BRD20_11275 [Halobacteriales archaeon SW_8_65_20]|nr:MAG: hypothetical protein BRC71_05385 [Halobacteriales archaeon QH_7_65_31]PSQ51302.1 MAG: hypothetical protein BRD20_11275 [Halobacteriales archaeon SW_8_65_20]